MYLFNNEITVSFLPENIKRYLLTLPKEEWSFWDREFRLFFDRKHIQSRKKTFLPGYVVHFKCRAIGRSENRGVPVLYGGHNLPPPLVEIGLTDLPKWHPRYPWYAEFARIFFKTLKFFNHQFLKHPLKIKIFFGSSHFFFHYTSTKFHVVI